MLVAASAVLLVAASAAPLVPEGHVIQALQTASETAVEPWTWGTDVAECGDKCNQWLDGSEKSVSSTCNYRNLCVNYCSAGHWHANETSGKLIVPWGPYPDLYDAQRSKEYSEDCLSALQNAAMWCETKTSYCTCSACSSAPTSMLSTVAQADASSATAASEAPAAVVSEAPATEAQAESNKLDLSNQAESKPVADPTDAQAIETGVETASAPAPATQESAPPAPEALTGTNVEGSDGAAPSGAAETPSTAAEQQLPNDQVAATPASEFVMA